MNELILLEKGKSKLGFFRENYCGRFLSGLVNVDAFVQVVERLSYDTDFYNELKINLAPNKLSRIIEELAFIRRPMRGADAFLHIAQEYSEFQNVKFILLDSVRPRNVKVGLCLPYGQRCSGEPKLTFNHMNVHAEMMLLTYLVYSENTRSEVFPYLGVSKKTCFLCGHMLRTIGQFEARGNHGKCYSKWTLPQAVWRNLDTEKTWCTALERLRDVLRDETSKAKQHL